MKKVACFILHFLLYIVKKISPHNRWKKFSRENVQGVERSGDKHFTQSAKRYSASNKALKGKKQKQY